jgi:hypothetical protein
MRLVVQSIEGLKAVNQGFPKMTSYPVISAMIKERLHEWGPKAMSGAASVEAVV